MTTLISLDPGLRLCGVAVFRDGVLTWAGLARNTNLTDRGAQAWLSMADAVMHALPMGTLLRPPDLLVHELMQVYETKRQKGDPADLIELAGVSGAVVGTLDPRRAISYLPREWKGQIGKEVHHPRARSKLSEQEAATLDRCLESVPVSLRHNVMDAVALGLFQLKRLKGGIVPR